MTFFAILFFVYIFVLREAQVWHLLSPFFIGWRKKAKKFTGALNIHMIREHGFYEGKDSPFRVEPLDLIRVLEIDPEPNGEKQHK